MLDIHEISEPKAAVGAKIEAPDPVKHILFTKAKCPDDVKTNDRAAALEKKRRVDRLTSWPEKKDCHQLARYTPYTSGL